MLTRLSTKRQGEEGVTMIELLVVLVIIGILATIAIAAFVSQRESAWDAAVKTDSRNAVPQIQTEFLDKHNANNQDTIVEGYAARTTDAPVAMDIEVGRGVVIPGAAGMSTLSSFSTLSSTDAYTVEDAIPLSPGTRGSIGGVASDFTVCFWNPSGDVFKSPDTARVWHSVDGTFRSPYPADECVAVAHRVEGTSPGDPSNPNPPGSGDDEDDGDEPGEGVDLGITAAIGDPEAYHFMGDFNSGIQFRVTLQADDPELLDELEGLTFSLGGDESRFNTYGNTWGFAGASAGYATPGGVAEVKLGDYVLGSRDFSDYEFIGHATLDPSDLVMTRSDLARIRQWVEGVAPANANTVSVRQYYQGEDFGWYKRASTSPGGEIPDLDLLSLNIGNDGYNIDAEFDVRNGTVRMEYLPVSGGQSIIVEHYASLDINGEGGHPGEEHPMVPGQPVGFEALADAKCAPHEDDFLAFQQAVYAHEPDLWEANWFPGSDVEIGLNTDDGWVDMTMPYDRFASDVYYASVSHNDGYFTGFLELDDNTICGTLIP